MPLILLLLGVVTTIAGAVLVASGLTFHGGTFDIEAITPGTVAAVGGLLLIGMGLAVRELKRIERALAARPMPRVNQPGDDSAVAAERTEPSVSLPFPSKPKILQAVDARSKPASADETAVEPTVKFPTLPGREEGPVAEEETVEVRQPAAATAGRGANGVSPARVAPRFDIKPRAAVHPMRRAPRVSPHSCPGNRAATAKSHRRKSHQVKSHRRKSLRPKSPPPYRSRLKSLRSLLNRTPPRLCVRRARFPFSSQAWSKVWLIRSIRTDRSKPSCRKGRCGSAQSRHSANISIAAPSEFPTISTFRPEAFLKGSNANYSAWKCWIVR